MPFNLPRFFSWSKQGQTQRQTKSANYDALSYVRIAGLLRGTGYGSISDLLAAQYYTKVAPLATAVDLIAQAAASIPPALITVDKEVILEHPLLDLLAQPNSDSTWQEFFAKSVGFRLLSGNTFWLGLGGRNRPFLSLECRAPQDVSEQCSTQDVFVGLYRLSTAGKQKHFEREEDISAGGIKLKGYHYFDSQDNELWHAKTFNPIDNGLRGLSPLSPIWSEIDQYVETSQHNLTGLKTGFNAKALIKTAMNDAQKGIRLTEEQRKDLHEQLQAFVGTASTKSFIASPCVEDVKQLSQSNRDMEFSELKKTVTTTIYNHLHIPLPFVSNDKSTFSNMEMAPTQLMDFAVLPHVNALLRELTQFLVPRYPDLVQRRARIGYNETEIPAIRARIIKEAQNLAKIPNTFRRDEIRAMVGQDPTDSPEVFVGASAFSLSEPPSGQNEDSAEKQQFIQAMMKTQGWSEGYCRKQADLEGL